MDPYVYQYLIGGVIFLIGIIYAARQGYIGLTGHGVRNLLILVVGLIFFMVVQGYLQYAPMNEIAAAVPAESNPAE